MTFMLLLTFYSKTSELSNKQPWRNLWKAVYLEWHACFPDCSGICGFSVLTSRCGRSSRVDQEWSNTSHDNILVTSKTKSQTDRITFKHFNNAEMKFHIMNIWLIKHICPPLNGGVSHLDQSLNPKLVCDSRPCQLIHDYFQGKNIG